MSSFLAAIRAAVIPAPEQEPAARSAPAGGTSAAYTEGVAAATARFSAILNADDIKGNASRMGVAIDLAARSPDMSAEDVTAFVIANVAAVSAALAAPVASLANRFTVDPVTGAKIGFFDNDPLGSALGGFLPPTAADGWGEAISKAAGKQEPAK